jgi:hypothetical protein
LPDAANGARLAPKLPIENGAKNVGVIIGPDYTLIGIEAHPSWLHRQVPKIPRISSKHNRFRWLSPVAFARVRPKLAFAVGNQTLGLQRIADRPCQHLCAQRKQGFDEERRSISRMTYWPRSIVQR